MHYSIERKAHTSKKQSTAVNNNQAQALAATATPSAGEQALTSEATGLMDWIKGGDYTNRPKNIFLNAMDPAVRNRQRQMTANAGAQGVYALGAPDPNLLAMNKQHLDDEWARDTSGQFEQDISQGGQRAAAALGESAGLENARELGRLGSTTQSYDIQLQQKPWWQQMLNSAAAGASQGARVCDLSRPAWRP